MKYRIEAGVETKSSLSTVKTFNNANELREYIGNLSKETWYVVEYADTHQEIVRYNYCGSGMKYNDRIKCPKALMNL